METSNVVEELQKRIARCHFVINGLKDNDAFKLALEDFENQRKMIDDNWQFVSDKSKLDELRITKLATMSVLNIIPNYQADLKKAEEELVKIENPDKLIGKDYDNA